MSGFLAGAGRVAVMWLLFGFLLSLLTGLPEGVAIVLAAVATLLVNGAWRQQQRQRLLREHREEVEHDEEVRQIVRERCRR